MFLLDMEQFTMTGILVRSLDYALGRVVSTHHRLAPAGIGSLLLVRLMRQEVEKHGS